MKGDSKSDAAEQRQSSALDQFFSYIKGEEGLWILDMGGASQANISFITGLGQRLCTEDYLRSADTAFGDGDLIANQSDSRRIGSFLRHNLAYPARHFDGALVWDALEFLAPPLLTATVDRLFEIMKPNSYLLAMFHSEERAHPMPTYSFRISGPKTLLLAKNGVRQPLQVFNNRALEKLFQKFDSVKFFLTRDHLREVIVKR